MLEEGQIKIIVWEENFCDDLIAIIDSNGFSLSTLNSIFEDWNYNEYLFGKYRNYELIVKPYYEPAQIGNYPPPNVECEAYWGCEVVSKEHMAYEEND